MKILITGTSGFIGGELVKTLIKENYEVWGLSRKYVDCGIEKSHYLTKDLMSDELNKTVPNDLDVIVHLAGIAAPSNALADPSEAMRVNALGTVNMLNLAKDRKIPLVFASSVYIYDGCTEFPWHEDMPLKPRSPLGASKLAAESIARAYAECFSVNSVALRFFTVYGPGSKDIQFIPSALKKIHDAKDVVEFGSSKSTRDFIFIDDVISGIISSIKFVKEDSGFNIFNFGSGKEMSIEKCVDLMVRLFGKSKLKIIFDKLPLRKDEVAGYSRHWSSIEKAKKILKWHPQISFEEGLKRTYEYMYK